VTSAAPHHPRLPAGARSTGYDVSLRDVLEGDRPAILERWRTKVFDSYSREAVQFFRSEKDAFRNPVGQSILRGTQVIYDGVALGREAGSVTEAIESLVRVRAVQELPASEAVGFVFTLKRAVREHLREIGAEGELWPELASLDERLDALASAAFDLYGHCRESVHQIRMGELRRSAAALRRQLDGPGRVRGSAATAGEGGGPEGGCEP
jgi:hypothetical protein